MTHRISICICTNKLPSVLVGQVVQHLTTPDIRLGFVVVQQAYVLPVNETGSKRKNVLICCTILLADTEADEIQSWEKVDCETVRNLLKLDSVPTANCWDAY